MQFENKFVRKYTLLAIISCWAFIMIKKRNDTLVIRSLLFFIFITYFPGLMLYPFFKEDFHSFYNLQTSPHLYFLANIFLFLLVFFAIYYLFINSKQLRIPLLSSRFVFFVFTFIVAIYFFASVDFFISYTSKFRHNSRVSDASSLVKLMFFLKSFIYSFVLMALIHILNKKVIGVKSKFLLLAILLSSILSINSSLQVFFAFIVLLVVFKPNAFIFEIKKASLSMLAFVLLSIVLVSGGIVFVGVGNKVGYDFLLTSEGLDFFFEYIGFLIPRISTALYSSATLIECCMMSFTVGMESIDNIIFTASNRLSLVFGGSFDSESINTISRSNYFRVFANHADRAGGTPGLLASMFYAPLYPITFFIVPLLTVIILRSVSYNIRTHAKCNFVGLITISFIFLNYFESPLNFLYIVEPHLFTILSFLSLRVIDISKLLVK